ncbi:terpenoid synthase-like protein [Leptotrombidium deliense]|uniref:Terpene synthase n=1 Tax=Leptotrombidium deliense TaxID=299467 RepID=A0A443S0C2_9ACAR|nr:terpenoid synthase-like protein [Leptotrombidium deliense]
MTRVTDLKRINWPFEGKLHNDAKLIEEKVNEWFKVYCKTNEMEEKYRQQRVPQFSSRNFNYGPFEKVLAIAKFHSYIFAFDDYFELEDDDAVEKLTANILSPSLENINFGENQWLHRGFNDVWECVSNLAPDEWNERQLNTIITWLKTIQMEKKFRNNVIPSSLEYLTLRPVSVGINMCFNFIEHAYGQYLSFETIAHPFFQAMLQHCRCIILATNDIYSYHKEQQSKADTMNLVMVYQNELNLSLEEAFDKVYDYNDENLRYYLMYKERVQATVKQDIQFYLHGLEQLIVGSYEFHFDSNRYD